eukprot:403350790
MEDNINQDNLQIQEDTQRLQDQGIDIHQSIDQQNLQQDEFVMINEDFSDINLKTEQSHSDDTNLLSNDGFNAQSNGNRLYNKRTNKYYYQEKQQISPVKDDDLDITEDASNYSNKNSKNGSKTYTLEELRIKESFHRMFVWSRVLLALSIIGLILTSVVALILLYMRFRINSIITFEVPQLNYLFTYQQRNQTAEQYSPIVVKLDEDRLTYQLYFGMIFCVIAFLQSSVGYLFVKPLFQMAQEKEQQRNGQVINESDVEAYTDHKIQIEMDNSSPVSIQKQQKKIPQLNHIHIATFKQLLLILSVIALFFLICFLYMSYTQSSKSLTKLIEDNIAAQGFDKITDKINDKYTANQAVEEIKDWQRKTANRFMGVGLALVHLFLLIGFTTLSAICVYSTHQLSRNQKRTEED